MTGGVSTRRLGGFWIVYQMMGLIGVELTRSCGLGHLNNRSCLYHYNLQDYVGLAVRLMRVCWQRVGLVDALATVSERVRIAGEVLARAFVRWVPDPDGMGLCHICQDGYELGWYGVLHCGHIMHLHFRLEYEAYEHGWAPHRLPECSVCKARFEGFVCICVRLGGASSGQSYIVLRCVESYRSQILI